MNTRLVNTAADVIARAMQQGRTLPAALAVALESAQLLQSPEVAAEREQLRNDITGACLARWEEEQENARLRLALKSAQRGRREMRSQRDEFCDRVDTLTAVAKGNKRHVQSLFAELQTAQRERDEARARATELEAERAKYVGAEPTIAEEMAYLSRCIDSVLDLCEKAEQQGITSGGAFTVDAIRAAAEGMVERTSYPPAVPWARLMDDEDRSEFLDELAASAVTYDSAQVLDEVEATIGRWRAIAEAQHAHNTAPGPGEETSR